MTKSSNVVSLMPGGGRLDWKTTVQALWTTFGETTRKATQIADASESDMSYVRVAASDFPGEGLTV